MSDIQLFRLVDNVATEIKGSSAELEKPLQNLIEANLEPLLAIRFLATEYYTGPIHKGRIDTLGLDENDCPVILEYKRSSRENVINQGLFYLNWLLDHREAFEILVLKRFGQKAADAIDWDSPRVICIAADFSRYDAHAVQQIDRNIELVRYRRFGPDLLLLEQVNTVASESTAESPPAAKRPAKATSPSPAKRPAPADTTPRPRWLPDLSPDLASLFESLDTYIRALGDDVQRKDLKLYVGYRRLKNFATVVGQKKSLLLYLHLDEDLNRLSKLDLGALRPVADVGHWGTGNYEMRIASATDLERAKPLLDWAYGYTLL
jgi:predicted transport protein